MSWAAGACRSTAATAARLRPAAWSWRIATSTTFRGSITPTRRPCWSTASARIAHNVLHGCYSSALRVGGNEHLIEYNEVYDVVRESDDQGGVDMFGNPSFRGNVYRWNYWHDIGNDLNSGVAGQAGIRLDDAISGVLIYGNLFYRCSDGVFGGVQIHGGRDNTVDNNLFLECRTALSFSPWPEERWKEFVQRPDVVKWLHGEVEIGQPPYSTRYPELARLAEPSNVNRVWRNIAVNCGQFLAHDRGLEQTLDNYVTGCDLPPGAAAGRFPLPPDCARSEPHRLPAHPAGRHRLVRRRPAARQPVGAGTGMRPTRCRR